MGTSPSELTKELVLNAKPRNRDTLDAPNGQERLTKLVGSSPARAARKSYSLFLFHITESLARKSEAGWYFFSKLILVRRA